MSKVPVIIAARNEEGFIGETLRRLDATKVQPIVCVNGCTDGTLDIVESFGVDVIVSEAEGKTLAVQEGLKYLGAKALEPVLYLDADTYPLFPSRWADSMVREALPAIANEGSIHVSGPYIFRPFGTIEAIRAYRHICRIHQAARGLVPPATGGCNMLTVLRSRKALEKMLDMPNYWEGEDQATRDYCDAQSQGTHPYSFVSTSNRRLAGLVATIKNRNASWHDRLVRSYSSDAPEGSTRYPLAN